MQNAAEAWESKAVSLGAQLNALMRTYQLEGISPAAVEAFHESRARGSPAHQQGISPLLDDSLALNPPRGVFVNEVQVIDNLVDDIHIGEDERGRDNTIVGGEIQSILHGEDLKKDSLKKDSLKKDDLSEPGDVQLEAVETDEGDDISSEVHVSHLREEVSDMKGRINDVFDI